MAPMPAFSSRRTKLVSRVKGEAPTNKGDFKAKPKYSVHNEGTGLTSLEPLP